MSADLFAEFSKPAESTVRGQQATPSQALFSLNSRVAQPSAAVAAADDDDGWGDFETAEPAPAVTGTKELQPAAIKTRQSLRAATNLTQQPPFVLDTTRPKPQAKAASGSSNVLFDVDDFELQAGDVTDDEDDFGDFASVAQPSLANVTTSTLSAAPSLDLIGLEGGELPPRQDGRRETAEKPAGALSFGTLPLTRSSGPPSSSTQEQNSALDLLNDMSEETSINLMSKSKPPASVPSRGTKIAVEDGDGDWAAWDDSPAPTTSVVGAQPSDGWGWDVEDSGELLAADSSNSAPPTNVPPPCVILSTFPELFSSGNLLFKPLMAQGASAKQQILQKPKAAQFLRGYILLGTTAARVLAGRKHRWQRDKMLARGMSLSAVGSKGMKLAGVDKSQSAREDREAAEVVASWREQVGRLRAAIAMANSGSGMKLRIPELSDKMQIQTAKMVPTAPWPCVICGLKRDERITKVDVEVEDSFGEWWVDHWGHRACKNFWLEHEPRLRQR
ncbi:hypothetical protein XA68_14443 [Ophiocordyceps unilateralis]|uniref:Serine/threonine-protein kinase ppk6 n=1 Tax=Ophiocordyceps unilateralis TaxID=268505 RepID=A0A2A9PA58_OPHUN|nr:hypothetical protein XA68_14443 [Ophiocordyceps unilateralis]